MSSVIFPKFSPRHRRSCAAAASFSAKVLSRMGLSFPANTRSITSRNSAMGTPNAPRRRATRTPPPVYGGQGPASCRVLPPPRRYPERDKRTPSKELATLNCGSRKRNQALPGTVARSAMERFGVPRLRGSESPPAQPAPYFSCGTDGLTRLKAVLGPPTRNFALGAPLQTTRLKAPLRAATGHKPSV